MNEYQNYRKDHENPYQRYIRPEKNPHDKDFTNPTSYDKSSRPRKSLNAVRWEKIKQVWDDCMALGWDEEDTAEALFGIVEELVRELTQTEDK